MQRTITGALPLFVGPSDHPAVSPAGISWSRHQAAAPPHNSIPDTSAVTLLHQTLGPYSKWRACRQGRAATALQRDPELTFWWDTAEMFTVTGPEIDEPAGC